MRMPPSLETPLLRLGTETQMGLGLGTSVGLGTRLGLGSRCEGLCRAPLSVEVLGELELRLARSLKTLTVLPLLLFLPAPAYPLWPQVHGERGSPECPLCAT
jgi:hypothetical protein